MKVVICWADIAGYTGACWRELSGRKGIDLHVIALKAGAINPHAIFDNNVVQGVPCTLLSKEQQYDADRVAELVIAQKPDVVILCGWYIPVFVSLAFKPELQQSRFVLAMDTPFRNTWRQWLGRFKVRRLLSRMERVMVAGERSWYLARHLGVPEWKIRRGMDSIDYKYFATAYARRIALPGGWPRRFLYTGRYLSIKSIDVLMAAYTKYRQSVDEPWDLTCCGSGEMSGLIESTPGVVNLGFVQPSNLAKVFAEHGVFILPSRFDPWPLVLVEACASGLPAIASNACGSAVEVVRTFHNGQMVTTGDTDSLAKAMHWMHQHYADLPEMGKRSSELASAYSAERWADRWTSMCEELA